MKCHVASIQVSSKLKCSAMFKSATPGTLLFLRGHPVCRTTNRDFLKWPLSSACRCFFVSGVFFMFFKVFLFYSFFASSYHVPETCASPPRWLRNCTSGGSFLFDSIWKCLNLIFRSKLCRSLRCLFSHKLAKIVRSFGTVFGFSKWVYSGSLIKCERFGKSVIMKPIMFLVRPSTGCSTKGVKSGQCD